MTLLPFQRTRAQRAIDALRRHRTALDASNPGCHAAGTPILLHDGSVVPVEAVCVGDRLMGWDSTPREVLALARGREAMACIIPVKGEPFTVNLSHIPPFPASGPTEWHFQEPPAESKFLAAKRLKTGNTPHANTAARRRSSCASRSSTPFLNSDCSLMAR